MIPGVSPPVTISFTHLSPGQVTPIDAPSVYMCAIEYLAKVCRYRPRSGDIGDRKVFSYGTATIKFERVEPRREPYFTPKIACAVLRGLPEYMTLNDWWVESFVRVYVEGTMVGSAQVWNPIGEGPGGSMDVVGMLNPVGFVATA